MNQNKITALIIPIALVFGATSFLVVTLFLSIDFKNFDCSFNNNISSPLIVPFMVLFSVCFVCSKIIPNLIKGKNINTEKVFLNKLIIKYALIEGSTFFGLVVFLVSYQVEKAMSFSPVWISLVAYFTLVSTLIIDLPRLLKYVKE